MPCLRIVLLLKKHVNCFLQQFMLMSLRRCVIAGSRPLRTDRPDHAQAKVFTIITRGLPVAEGGSGTVRGVAEGPSAEGAPGFVGSVHRIDRLGWKHIGRGVF